MKRIFKKELLALFLISMILVPADSCFAYTDSIVAPASEIYDAIHDLIEPLGIKNEDSEKFEIESKWIEDTVVRKKKWLPFINLGRMSKRTKRRYRMKFSLIEKTDETEVTIKGTFQEARFDSRPHDMWKRIKAKSEDFDAERDFFYKVLRKLQSLRNEEAQKPSNTL